MGLNLVALVTGASRGIGREIAITLGRKQFDVVVNYATSADAAMGVVKTIEQGGSRATMVQADVALGADREMLVAATMRAFGRIDLLINNAGVAPKVRADLLEASEESFDRLMGINLKGPYFLTQLVAREMVAAIKSGRQSGSKIINISSMSAYTVDTYRGDYCVSKSGLAMMTQLFATRLAEYGIGVFELRPGIIETDMTGPVKAKYDKLILEEGITPIRRWGQPDDVAKAVLAIAKDSFPFSTGDVINIDGGFHLRRL